MRTLGRPSNYFCDLSALTFPFGPSSYTFCVPFFIYNFCFHFELKDEIHELDLRDANVVNSPYYYMQQRDILYVEPNTAMAQEGTVSTTNRLWLRGVSIVISLGSLMYRVLE